MTKKSSGLGKLGEKAAARYLRGKKYRILETNFRRPWGELDIVALAPGGILVFVEVKTLRQVRGKPTEEQLKPEDHMNHAKMEKFRRVASLYAGSHPKLIKEKRGWRLDLVALVHEENRFRVRHYENV